MPLTPLVAVRPRALQHAVLGSVASGLGGQFGLVISGILLARGLGPTSRGLLALLLLWPIVLFQIGSLGLPVASAYFIARNPASARTIVGTLLRATIVPCACLVGVHIVIVVLLVHGRDPTTQLAGYVTLATIPTVFLQEYSTSILQGQQRFTALSLARLMPAGANAMAAVAVWLLFRSLLGAALFLTVANVLVALITARVAAAQLQKLPSTVAIRLRDLIRFGLRAWIGAVYPVETFRVDQAVVGLLLSPAALGIYVVSLAFTNLPRFIAQSVGLVAYPHIAAQDPASRRASTWRFFWAAVALSAVTVAVLELAVGSLVPLAFGSAFAPAIPIARILLVASLLAAARRILAEGMKGAGYPGAGTVAEVASWLSLAPLMVILTPRWGLTGVAAAVTASSGLSLLTLAAIDLFHGRAVPGLARGASRAMKGSASGPVRLTLFTMSPVYYQVPLYRLLAADARLDFSVLYASSGGIRPAEAGYGHPVAWDTDLLGGYRAGFVARSQINSIGDGGFFGLRDFDVVGRILDLDPEVLWLFGYNYLSHQLAALTQKVRRRPLLFREEQTLLESRPFWKRAIKAVAMRALFAGGGAMYIGTRNRDWFAHYGVAPERLFFTPYSVDNERLRADHVALGRAKTTIQAEFGIKENAGPVLLTVSRFITKKQPLHLIEAFRRLRQECDCTLLLVGSGPLEPAMREKVLHEQIPDVIFAGFMNQSSICRAYAAADIFVLPSAYGETWGVSVNEAMNFALPVVVSDRVGSAIDLVAEGENGFVVDPSDLEALVSRLRLLMDRDVRRSFGAASLERVERHNYSIAASGVIRAVAAAVGTDRWARAEAAAAHK